MSRRPFDPNWSVQDDRPRMTRPPGADYPWWEPPRVPRRRFSIGGWLENVFLPWLAAWALPVGLIAIVALTAALAWRDARAGEWMARDKVTAAYGCWTEESAEAIARAGGPSFGVIAAGLVLGRACWWLPTGLYAAVQLLERVSGPWSDGVHQFDIWRGRILLGGQPAGDVVYLPMRTGAGPHEGA